MSYQRRKDQRPEEIRAAALSVFTDSGFASANMSDIAARAGVSRPTLYLYYPNKEAIFEALVRENVVPVIARAGAGLDAPEGSATDLLHTALSTFFGQILRSEVSAILRLLIAEGARFPQLTALYKAELVDPGRAILTRILTHGVQTGEFRAEAAEIDPRFLLAPGLMAMVWTSLFHAQEPLDVQALLPAYTDVLLSGLVAQT